MFPHKAKGFLYIPVGKIFNLNKSSTGQKAQLYWHEIGAFLLQN
jgi:hypothetical protein